MDYEREDRLATLRGRVAIESAERAAAGDPFTLNEAAAALGLAPIVSEDDMGRLAVICRRWGIETNMDAEPVWRGAADRWLESAARAGGAS